MKTPMKVDFDDTEANWRLWGELVKNWIFGRHPKPTDTTKLINQMTAHGISGAGVYGPTPREVKFYSYGEEDPLVIELPTEEMLQDGHGSAKPGEPYPLPAFYDAAFSGERQKFTAEVIKRFSTSRIGEYTINMCM